MKECCVFLKTLKGGFASNYFIPVIRREPPKKPSVAPVLKKAETMVEDEKPYSSKPTEGIMADIGDSRSQARNDSKRVTSLPRQQVTSSNWRESSSSQTQAQSQSLTRKKTAPLIEKDKENQPAQARPPKQKDFSKTATEGFRRYISRNFSRGNQFGDQAATVPASLNNTGELPARKPLVQKTRAAKEEALRGTVYRIKKNAADNMRKEKKKRDEGFGNDGSRNEEPPIAVNATRIRQNMGTPPVQSLSQSEHLAPTTHGGISLAGGKHSIDIHIGNVNTYNIYVHPDAKGLQLSAPPESELRKVPNSKVLKAAVPNLIASGRSLSNSQAATGTQSKRPTHNLQTSKNNQDSTAGIWSGFHQTQPVQQTMNNTAGSFKIGKVKRNNFLSQSGKDSAVEKRNGSPSHALAPTPPLPTVAVGQGSVLSKYRMYQTNPHPPNKRKPTNAVSEGDKPPSLANTFTSGFRSTAKPTSQLSTLSGVTLKAL